jgi:hypothetical protein
MKLISFILFGLLGFLGIALAADTQGSSLPIQIGGTDTTFNTPYVAVTICLSGTETCQTIPQIRLDSASSGLRLKSSAISIALTPEKDSSQAEVAECWKFGGGEVLWGPVAQADVILGTEKAANVPIQIVNSNYATVPSSCPGLNITNQENGILGIGPAINDTGNGNLPGVSYYLCSAGTCTASSIDPALHIQNPVSMMPVDNNGVTIAFPSVPPTGSASVTGSLTLGVGTNANNQPAQGTTTFLTNSMGWLKASFEGNHYFTMFDTGTDLIILPSSHSVDNCSRYGWSNPAVCPTSEQDLSVDFQGIDGSTHSTVSFTIDNAEPLLSSGMKAFNNVGMQLPQIDTLVLGMSFFYGKTVYIGIDGKTSALGTGPYAAF